MDNRSLASNSCLFLSTFRCPPDQNMLIDRWMLDCLCQSQREEIWRIYSWEPSAISVGKNQKIDTVIEREKILEKGIELVKRPTGGRAIYHKGDICISTSGMINSRQDPGLNAMSIYNRFAEILSLFFENIRVKVEIARGPRFKPVDRSGIGKLPCFLSATPYELLSSGKKIAGIALFSAKDRYLIQSSIRIKQYSAQDFQFFKGLTFDSAILANITSCEQQIGRHLEEFELEQALIKMLSETQNFNVKQIDVKSLKSWMNPD